MLLFSCYINSVRTLNDTSNLYTDKIILNKDYFNFIKITSTKDVNTPPV